jgi:hypothetical protein
MKTARVTNRGLLARDLGKALVVSAVFLALACSSMTEPRVPVTLLVTNATCDSGTCSPIEVRGFPSDQPNTPGGPWSLKLGTVSTASACLTLPSADTARVTNADTGETTTYVWTIDDLLALGTLEPGESWFQAKASTSEFVPGNAAGWAIALPGATTATPAGACR